MTVAMKLKDTCSWKKNCAKLRQHIKKKRHYFADKGPYSQSYGFSSGHVWMWELDHKENWMPKNWCFWTLVLEKTVESPWAARRSNQSILKKINPEYSRPTLCNPMDYTAYGILQARILEWVTFPYSRVFSQPRDLNPGLPHCRRILCQLSHKGSPKILKCVVYHFSGDLPNPGIEPGSLELQVNSLTTELSGKEGLMLKLNCQYFWHLMQRANSLEKTLTLGKIEVRRRRGW